MTLDTPLHGIQREQWMGKNKHCKQGKRLIGSVQLIQHAKITSCLYSNHLLNASATKGCLFLHNLPTQRESDTGRTSGKIFHVIL